MKIYHVWGRHWRGDVLYGTFSTREKAELLAENLRNSATNDYNYSIDVEEAELDYE